MENQLWGVIVGAAIASVVPLLTLRTTHAQWRLERRIELLRNRQGELGCHYARIFEQLPSALREKEYPISMMASISVNTSPTVRKLYYDYMDSKERDEAIWKNLLLDMSLAANEHIASIEAEIENLLK